MKIKSLLLGSAAALVVVSGAQAADAIVAAAPEPVEYVKVCDAFGTGYFYIPGTETCLKLSGYARVQNDYKSTKITGTGLDPMPATTAAADKDTLHSVDKATFGQTTKFHLAVTAKSETEYGALTGYGALNVDTADKNGKNVKLDKIYLSLGGFKAGYFTHWNDRGIAGETDSMAGSKTKFNSVMYSGNAGAFKYGVSLDQNGSNWYDKTATPEKTTMGISGMVGATVGAVDADIVVYYGTSSKNWGARFLANAAMGPGKLGVSAVYNGGESMYFNAGYAGFDAGFVTKDGTTGYTAPFAYAEWIGAASYAYKVNDKLTLTPGIQYTSYKFIKGATALTTPATASTGIAATAWKGGLTADYTITTGLALKATVNYEEAKLKNSDAKAKTLSGFVRLQRSF